MDVDENLLPLTRLPQSERTARRLGRPGRSIVRSPPDGLSLRSPPAHVGAALRQRPIGMIVLCGQRTVLGCVHAGRRSPSPSSTPRWLGSWTTRKASSCAASPPSWSVRSRPTGRGRPPQFPRVSVNHHLARIRPASPSTRHVQAGRRSGRQLFRQHRSDRGSARRANAARPDATSSPTTTTLPPTDVRLRNPGPRLLTLNPATALVLDRPLNLHFRVLSPHCGCLVRSRVLAGQAACMA